MIYFTLFPKFTLLILLQFPKTLFGSEPSINILNKQLIEISFKLLQFKNALFCISDKLLGSDIVFRFEQFLKAFSPIIFKLDELSFIETNDKSEQFKKALVCISLNLSGISILGNFTQSLKALFCISNKFELVSISTLNNSVQSSKHEIPILSIYFPILMFFNVDTFEKAKLDNFIFSSL